MKTYVLYNSKSNNNTGRQGAEKLREIWKTRDLEFADTIEFGSYESFFAKLSPDETKLADADGDGSITANDALAVLRYSVGIIDEDSPIKKPVMT